LNVSVALGLSYLVAQLIGLAIIDRVDLTGASLEEIERKLADGRFKPADFTRTEAAPSPR
jgi:hypothetical protein